MNQTSIFTTDRAGHDPSRTTAAPALEVVLHWLTMALCGLGCSAPFVAWTVPVRQALAVAGL